MYVEVLMLMLTMYIFIIEGLGQHWISSVQVCLQSESLCDSNGF